MSHAGGSVGGYPQECLHVVCRGYQAREHKHMFLGLSDIAGWGIFAGCAIHKHEFIHECAS